MSGTPVTRASPVPLILIGQAPMPVRRSEVFPVWGTAPAVLPIQQVVNRGVGSRCRFYLPDLSLTPSFSDKNGVPCASCPVLSCSNSASKGWPQWRIDYCAHARRGTGETGEKGFRLRLSTAVTSGMGDRTRCSSRLRLRLQNKNAVNKQTHDSRPCWRAPCLISRFVSVFVLVAPHTVHEQS